MSLLSVIVMMFLAIGGSEGEKNSQTNNRDSVGGGGVGTYLRRCPCSPSVPDSNNLKYEVTQC